MLQFPNYPNDVISTLFRQKPEMAFRNKVAKKQTVGVQVVLHLISPYDCASVFQVIANDVITALFSIKNQNWLLEIKWQRDKQLVC